VSVHLVGVYLVFPTLIVPPLAARNLGRFRMAAAWMLGAAGYAIGLVLSTVLDLPTRPVIVWTLAALGVAMYAIPNGRTPTQSIASH